MKKGILTAITICLALVATIGNAKNSKLSVGVDERMEMLATIQYLAEYPILTKADIDYIKDINSYFKPYKEHNAVKLYKQIQALFRL